jgi:hypothetical protein
MQCMDSFGDDVVRLESWESTGPTREVGFLDLHIQPTPDGSITTSTYQKPMNVHLFCPPTSVQTATKHPLWPHLQHFTSIVLAKLGVYYL